MVAYKKTLKNVASHWYSLMRAGFRLCRPFAGHGHPVVKPLCCDAREAGVRFRQFPPSAYRRKEKGWRSISGFIWIKIFVLEMLCNFCAICVGICAGVLSWCGIAVPFIGQKQSVSSWPNIPASEHFGFPGTLRNSIRMNLSGRNLNERWLTAYREIRNICTPCCKRRFVVCAALKNCCVRVSMLLPYRGDDISITYA
jgi:hypothetical protein